MLMSSFWHSTHIQMFTLIVVAVSVYLPKICREKLTWYNISVFLSILSQDAVGIISYKIISANAPL